MRPGRRTVFVGRDDELAWLAERIGEGASVVTVFGPPGVGKTRLAAEARALVGLGLGSARATVGLDEAIALARRTGDRATEIHALGLLARAKRDEGELLPALSCCTVALRVGGGTLERLDEGASIEDVGEEARLEVARAHAQAALVAATIHLTLRDSGGAEEAVEISRLAAAEIGQKGSSEALLVHREGNWFRVPGQAVVQCRTRQAIRQILAKLAEQRLVRPGEPLSSAELIAIGWPAERIAVLPARNRLKQSMLVLRKLGLGDLLLGRHGGYLLDPHVALELCQPSESVFGLVERPARTPLRESGFAIRVER